MYKPRGTILVELVLVAAILVFVAGAIWYAGSKPSSSNQAAVSGSKGTPTPTTPGVSQITSASDVDNSIKELDQESTTQLDTDLDDIDSSLKSL